MKIKRNWKRLIALLCGVVMMSTMFSGVGIEQAEASTTEEDKKVITNCDSTEGITLNGRATYTEDAEYVSEGEGAFLFQNPGRTVFEMKLSNPIDISKYETIHLSLYIKDKTVWNGTLRINISSAQESDTDCIRWVINQENIKVGWNELNLKLTDYTNSTGNFNNANLNYIKIWQGGGNAINNQNLNVSVDDIYAHQVFESKVTAQKYTSNVITGGVVPSREDYDWVFYKFGGWFKNYDASAEKDKQFTNPLSKGEEVTATTDKPVYAKLVPKEVLSTKAQYIRNSESKKEFATCDDADGIIWNGAETYSVTTTTGEYKEGTGAFKSVGLGTWRWYEVVLSEPVNISAYEDGSLHLQLYISDATKLKDTVMQIQLGSAGKADDNRFLWNATVQSDWNELALDFADANDNGVDLSNINYLRIYRPATESITVVLDDIYATRETQGKTLFNCDETANISSTNGTINKVKSYVKEGKGSLHANTTGLSFALTDAVDISAFKNGTLHFWLYIEDVSKITGTFYVDLTSNDAGTQRLRWYMSGSRLQTGWNELYLPLANPRETTTGDNNVFNPASVKYFCVSWNGNATNIYMDDVRIVNAVYLMTGHNGTELYGSSNVGTTITNEAGEYLFGTGAYANNNSTTKVRHAAQVRVLGYTDATAYKIADEYQTNGVLHFWLNISNINAWNGDMTVQLSSDASTPDANHLQWTVSKEHLKEGWNEFYLNLSQAGSTGTVDYTNINFFRVMMAEDSDTNFSTMLDDVSIVTNDTETVDMRFVSTVDSLQYAEVKIKIEKSGSSSYVCEPSKIVYKALNVMGSNSVVSKELPTVFHSESQYFFTQTITNMPIRVFDSVFTATPYWTTLDGTEVEGISRTYIINQAISSNIEELIGQKELTDPRGKTLEDTSTGEVNPQIVETLYETKDVVIADIIPTEMGYAVDPTGATDSAAGIQKALYDCHDAGGGTVYLPAGNYAISHSIYIPPYVTLRGDWQEPDVGTEYGTIISVWMEADDSERTGIFRMGSCGGAMGLTVYYPLQTLDSVIPYPYTFFVAGSGADHTLITISDVTIINGYRGIGTEYYTSNECLQVDNIRGTYLLNGYKGLYSTDVGNVTNFKVSNKYWKEAGADCMNYVSASVIDAYTKQNTTGMQLGDCDWTFLSNIDIDGCAIGIQGIKGMRSEMGNAYHGTWTDVTITNCEKGIVFDSLNTLFGAAIAKSYVEGGIHNNTDAPLKLCDVEVEGGIHEQVTDSVTVDETDLSGFNIDYDASYVKPASNLVVLNDLPKGTYEDVAPKVQDALDQMAEEGGGVVYIPGGVYSFQTPITVPAGVELRGATSVATREITYDFAGTLFLCYYGDDATSSKDDEAFITLAGDNAGLNGIRIVYPENSPKSEDTKTTYVVRGKGTGVYVVHSMISGSYYGIDFTDCDNHYLYGVTTCCYYNAFLLGGDNGVMTRCLQNGTVQARVSTPYMIDGVDSTGLFTELIDPILKQTAEWVIVENATNQLIFNAFSYGSNKGIININSENTILNNFGADNLTDALIQMQSGSLTAINTMRLGGTSYSQTGGCLTWYNSLVYGASGVTTTNETPANNNAGVNATINTVEYKDLGDSEDMGVSILACDQEDEFELLRNGWFTRVTEEYVQGTGALAIGSLRKTSFAEGVFGQVDISAYKTGSLHVSLYVDKPEKIGTAVILEFSSSGSSDSDKMTWTIPAVALQSGWNDLYLSMEDATKTGDIDLTGINYFRLRASEIEIGANLILDNVYATDTEASSLTAIREQKTATTKEGYLMDCDTLDGLSKNSSCILAVNEAGNHSEGTGAIAMTNFEYIAAQLQTVDISEYKNGTLCFELYVNDKAYIQDVILRVELTSGGIQDVEELNWTVSGESLETGWNTIYLRLPDAGKTGGDIDLTRVNFMKIWTNNAPRSLMMFLDAVRMETMPTRVATDGKIAGCNSLTEMSVRGQGGIFSITSEPGQYKEGTGALKGIYSQAVEMEIHMYEYVDISAYKDGSLKFWLNVDGVSKLGGPLRVELSSAGQDVSEYQWAVSKEQLVDGWNEITLKFNDASKSADGGVDFAKVCRFRIYNTEKSSGEVTLILDDVRVVE